MTSATFPLSGPRSVLRLLFLEDDATVREATGSYLQQRGGFQVDFALNTQQADEQLANNKYDVILADVLLKDPHGARVKQGDEWLLERQTELEGSFQAILTAQKDRLVDPEQLHQLGIPVILKGGEEIELYQKLEALLHKPAVGSEASLFSEAAFIEPDDAMLTRETLSLFYDWVDRHPRPDVKNVWLGGSLHSPSDLGREIAAGSSLGNRMAALFIAHLRSVLGLDKEDDE